jgi:hypothetical protein
MNSTEDVTERCLGRGNNPKLPAAVLGRTVSPYRFGDVTSTGYAPVGRVVSFPWLPGMAGLALVTPRIAVQGGHGLAVKTMFRFNPISPNKDECVGCLGYGRV